MLRSTSSPQFYSQSIIALGYSGESKTRNEYSENSESGQSSSDESDIDLSMLTERERNYINQQQEEISKQEKQIKHLKSILRFLKQDTEALDSSDNMISNLINQELAKLTPAEIAYIENTLQKDSSVFDLYKKIRGR